MKLVMLSELHGNDRYARGMEIVSEGSSQEGLFQKERSRSQNRTLGMSVLEARMAVTSDVGLWCYWQHRYRCAEIELSRYLGLIC